jgi:hypothetical protein
MKNKKLIYVLFPLVILIWGFIFYRILSHSGNDQFEQVTKKTINVRSSTNKEDTISLSVNYRDPFLGSELAITYSKSENVIKSSLSNKTNIQQTHILMSIPIDFPEIRYFGFITNQKDKKKLGLIRVNNKDILMKEGEFSEGFKVVKIFDDSINICYKNNFKVYKKYSNK